MGKPQSSVPRPDIHQAPGFGIPSSSWSSSPAPGARHGVSNPANEFCRKSFLL